MLQDCRYALRMMRKTSFFPLSSSPCSRSELAPTQTFREPEIGPIRELCFRRHHSYHGQ
jgi:hypothetical protein